MLLVDIWSFNYILRARVPSGWSFRRCPVLPRLVSAVAASTPLFLFRSAGGTFRLRIDEDDVFWFLGVGLM